MTLPTSIRTDFPAPSAFPNALPGVVSRLGAPAAVFAAFWLTLFAAAGSVAAQEAPTNLVYPVDVAVSGDGEVYIVDLKLPGVWKLKDGKPQVYVRGERKFRTPLNAARCAVVDAKGLLVGDSASTSVLRISAGAPVAAHEGRIGIPMAAAVAKGGDILVADLELHRIWRFPAAGGKPVEFAQVAAPRGLAVDADGKVWVVSHARNHQVVRLDADGKNPEVIVKGRPFRFPNQIAVDSKGVAFVADGFAKTIWRIPVGGEPAKLTSEGPLKNPVGLAVLGEELLVADPHAKKVFAVKVSDGTIRTFAGAP